MNSKNYQWYVHANLRRYKGEWVAIASQKVVAHGSNAQKVLEIAQKKYPHETPALAKVPQEDVLVL